MKTNGPERAIPSAETPGLQRLRDDVRASLRAFPRDCIFHLRNNLDRLEPGVWHNSSSNKGCVFYLLSEMLPDRIRTIHDLANYFPEDAATLGTSHMPARLVLRAFDGYNHKDQVDQTARERYDGTVLGEELLRQELDEVIGSSQPTEVPEVGLRWDLHLAIG